MMLPYSRGEIYYVSGGKDETDKTRPAVIVSNDDNNLYSPVLEMVFLTTQAKKPLPTHCIVLASHPSIAMCENVYTVSKSRIRDYIRTCSDLEMQNIEHCLKISLGIKE